MKKSKKFNSDHSEAKMFPSLFSHCMFSVKLLRIENEDPDVTHVSR